MEVVIEAHYNQQIVSLVRRLQELKEQRKASKEMIEDYLMRDEDYRYLANQIEDQKKLRNAKKQLLMAYTDGQSLAAADEDVKGEIKDVKESLSIALETHYVSTGVPVIHTPSGESVEIARSYAIKPSQMKLF